MRKLIISLVIILLFAFSLSKNNPIKEEKQVKKNKLVSFLGIKCKCFMSPCPCGGMSNSGFMKLSKSTFKKISKNSI